MDEGQTRGEVWLLAVLCGYGGAGDERTDGLVEATAGEYEGEVGTEEIECEGGPDEEEGDLGKGRVGGR